MPIPTRVTQFLSSLDRLLLLLFLMLLFLHTESAITSFAYPRSYRLISAAMAVDGKMSWIWRKGVSVGKKILAVGFVVSSAPFFVPPLVVAFTIALISSLPYWFFLASYVFTEKIMRKLLPASAFGDKMMLLRNKVGHGNLYYDEGIARAAMSKEEGTGGAIAFSEEDRTPLRVTNIFVDMYPSPGVMRKDSKSLLESQRDEDRTNQSLDRGIYGKGLVSSDAKSEKVGAGKKKVFGTRHEGELKPTTTEASKGKDMEKSSNEMKVLYSEEQIWEKMEALRKIVGYSVARSTTCSEELKALYLFMGVELPTSMLEKENQDIAQVSEKLSFLMSLIGIK